MEWTQEMKLYLCGMTSAGNEQNLRELIEPILEYFDGLVWTFHLPTLVDGGVIDKGFLFLYENKKEGKIVTAEWSQRHFNSMNQYLWQGPMQDGDFFIQIDTLERMSPKFCSTLRDIISSMIEQNIGMVANYGKGLIFRYSEILEFRGSPHWTPINIVGMQANTELEKSEFWSVRDEQRSPFHFVDAYLKYYLYPAGSNHGLLGLEKNGDPAKLFPIREERRLKFRNWLRDLNIELHPDAVVKYFLEIKNGNDPMCDTLKDFVNSEKILNDAWRYYVLEDKDFKDDHDDTNMIKI